MNIDDKMKELENLMKEADAYLDDNSINLCKNHKKEREELARRRKEIDDFMAKNGADLWKNRKKEMKKLEYELMNSEVKITDEIMIRALNGEFDGILNNNE